MAHTPRNTVGRRAAAKHISLSTTPITERSGCRLRGVARHTSSAFLLLLLRLVPRSCTPLQGFREPRPRQAQAAAARIVATAQHKLLQSRRRQRQQPLTAQAAATMTRLLYAQGEEAAGKAAAWAAWREKQDTAAICARSCTPQIPARPWSCLGAGTSPAHPMPASAHLQSSHGSSAMTTPLPCSAPT